MHKKCIFTSVRVTRNVKTKYLLYKKTSKTEGFIK